MPEWLKGNSIHCSIAMRYFKNAVDDKSIKAGDEQHIITNNNYVIPLSIKNGSSYMAIQSYSDAQWNTLLHPVLTSDVEWDLSVFDNHVGIDDDT